ncbi:filamentous hemagglutinin N-terminal domain-containing protein [Campylobacter peloridis]|uniref:Filamentous hemagglutinin N-terminal domain-containing protein n=1 Tax=Campylobacter peloridis TaxID=488546 RepID=A0ABX6TT53_9BACT|nr:filamentous hemagglutinin N-terminal domain-containing protein [Campylobacter peloridis]QOQ89118.1 filamentous hemagglutinin N-terminal domain-containing protein [Campylobacter peloridis]
MGGGESNNFDLTPSKKLTNHILLSSIVASLLFSPLAAISPNALPSGGKFTHGTSGTITKPNNTTMNIHGNKINSVIQWGGGFNIGNKAQVNFEGSGKNYLNIAHGTNKSTIAGILNAKDNNVFLINPNGVIITKTGNINANRFVASTSSMSNEDMNKFANLSQEQGNSFSPVFKPQKAGSVVNMGNINANDVLLIGNKVDIQGGKVGNKNSTTHLVGNDLVLNPSSFAENKTNNITALNSVELSASMSAFEDGEYKFVGGDSFTLTNYTDNNNKLTENKVQKIDFKQYLTIDSVGEWVIFANAWNNNKGDTRKVKEFRLINNIDFNNDFKPEYMVGYVFYDSSKKAYDWSSAFTSTFNGNGYTLSNIKLDTSSYSSTNKHKDHYVGIFSGVGNGGVVKNLKVENIATKGQRATGTIAGASDGGSFYDISMKNIKEVYATNNYAGGFIGLIRGANVGNYERISIDGIEKVYANGYSVVGAGAFTGSLSAGIFKDISINNVGIIYGTASGGFAGMAGQAGSLAPNVEKMIFENIKLTDYDAIGGNWTWTGGFIANFWGHKTKEVLFKNILLDDIRKITAEQAVGGFIARSDNGKYENITLNNIGEISATRGHDSSGGFIGIIENGEFKNIKLNDIDLIKFVGNQYYGLFAGEISKGKYENISISNVKNIDIKNSRFGLFAGMIGKSYTPGNSNFKSIIIHDISNIKYDGYTSGGYGDPYYGYMGVFAIDAKNATLENIFISLKGLTISNDYRDDLRFQTAFIYNNESNTAFSDNNVIFKNVNVYYDKDLFSAYDKVDSGKYQNNVNFLQNQYDNFIASAQTATGLQYDKTSNSFQTTTDFKLTDPIFTTIGEGGNNPNEVKLDENDLLQEMIKKEIIANITNGKYKLHISDLLKMLEDKANYSNMGEEQKVEFVAKYFLSGDKTKALEVVQSLDFLLAYEKNGLSTASNDKFKGNGFSTKESILKQVNNTTKNIKDKINQLNDELKSLANESKGFLKDLIAKQNELDVVIKAYNKYVVLINKGLAHKNDPEFVILKNKIDTLMKDSQDLAILINTKQNELSTWQNKNNTENFKVIGAFANVVLNTNPKLDQIKGDGGEGEDPNKPELPEIDLEFEQTASLNLIGDESLEEEEEEHEIEEAAITQRARTCIVSDNFKTMNPCVVGGY